MKMMLVVCDNSKEKRNHLLLHHHHRIIIIVIMTCCKSEEAEMVVMPIIDPILLRGDLIPLASRGTVVAVLVHPKEAAAAALGVEEQTSQLQRGHQ